MLHVDARSGLVLLLLVLLRAQRAHGLSWRGEAAKPAAASLAAHTADAEHKAGAEKRVNTYAATDSYCYETSSGEEHGWVAQFCAAPGHELFVEVPADFIKDGFNLVDIGKGTSIPYYREALGVLLDEPLQGVAAQKFSAVEASAELLYGLIHARYVLTPAGIEALRDKFVAGVFGRCPRVYCHGQPVLPVGLTDRPHQSAVCLYCPRCGDVYQHRSRANLSLDGAYWGTTAAHLLLMHHTELRPKRSQERYIPRIFGFKVMPRGQAKQLLKGHCSTAATAAAAAADGRSRSAPAAAERGGENFNISDNFNISAHHGGASAQRHGDYAAAAA